MTTPRPLTEADRLILAAGAGRRLSDEEIATIVQHVATAGFHPTSRSRVGGLAAGRTWRGGVLRAGDTLPTAEAHFLRHALRGLEWPPGTTPPIYEQSIREVVRDPHSALVVSQFDGEWQFTAVRRSEGWQGAAGFGWIVVEYRVSLGHWVTAFQPAAGIRALVSPRRTN